MTSEKIHCANCHKELDDVPIEDGFKFMFALCGECQGILYGGDMKQQARRFGHDI